MNLSLESWVMQSDVVLAREIEGETVILEFERAEYFGLNHTGSRIWELLQQPVALGAVSNQLATDFAIASDRAAADVLALVQHLVEHGLAKVVTAPGR